MRPKESFVGQPIRSLQTMLRVLAEDDRTLPTVVPDGIYGPETITAISAFQRRMGLPVTDQGRKSYAHRDHHRSRKGVSSRRQQRKPLLTPGNAELLIKLSHGHICARTKRRVGFSNRGGPGSIPASCRLAAYRRVG